jgi:hypothetical protein
MQAPKNADRIADIAKPTGRTHAEALGSLQRYVAMGFWPPDDDGLDQTKLEATVQSQIKIGNIKDPAKAVKYDRLVDRSVWRDASALAGK